MRQSLSVPSMQVGAIGGSLLRDMFSAFSDRYGTRRHVCAHSPRAIPLAISATVPAPKTEMAKDRTFASSTRGANVAGADQRAGEGRPPRRRGGQDGGRLHGADEDDGADAGRMAENQEHAEGG